MKTAKEALRESIPTGWPRADVTPSSDEIIQNLWGLGYTIVRRQSDHLYVDERIIPRGMAYQWCRIGDRHPGWSAVPASRHDGIFAPAGYQGDIEFGGLILMEKPKHEVDADLAANANKAQKQVDDWVDRNAEQAVGDLREIHVGVPPELVPYISEILAERDVQLKRMDDSHGVKARALNIAIAIIRDRRKDELNAENSSTDAGRNSAEG